MILEPRTPFNPMPRARNHDISELGVPTSSGPRASLGYPAIALLHPSFLVVERQEIRKGPMFAVTDSC